MHCQVCATLSAPSSLASTCLQCNTVLCRDCWLRLCEKHQGDFPPPNAGSEGAFMENSEDDFSD
eukprot:7226189-Prorocentrum_lima.AAC.1